MAEVTQAEHGWTYIGPDGEWHWSREFDNHESCEGHRPATAVEAALVADERRHRTEAVKPLVEALEDVRMAAKLAVAMSDPAEQYPWQMIMDRCAAALRSVQS